jgi:glycosyltransferase involved in cell wall biosynthesis
VKVGLNATCLNDRPSGAKQRFEGIYGALMKRLPEVEFVLYEPADCRVADWFSGTPNVTARRTSVPSEGRVGKFLHALAYWPSGLRGENFDVFECFNQPLVKSPNGRTLTTIHDIRRVYDDWNFAERQVYTWSLRHTLDTVDQVITVSEAMKGEILAFHPEARVTVIYNGLDPRLFAAVTEAEMQRVRLKFGLPEEFVLAVGHFEARKNYLRLIDAVKLLRDRGFSCSLVIVGNDSGERRLVEERVAAFRLGSSVKILSGLSDLEVRCTYKLSTMLVFPSAYEGFGIPILEAMAAGIPTVLSDIPVFREITEGRGVYFPHHSPEGIADAIQSTLTSPERLAELVQYGEDRVHDFSFDSLSAQVAGLYAKLSA